MRTGTRVVGALCCLLLATACSSGTNGSEPTTAGAAHHDTTLPAGEGLHSSYVGYSLQDVQLPDKVGTPSTYSFRIGTYRHRPQTKFEVDLTKRMHVYLVRDDLAVFRHVHPTMAPDGTWRGRVTLPQAGTYRLIAEFVASGAGGSGDHLILADPGVVAHRVAATRFGAVTGKGSSEGLTVSALTPISTGTNGEMQLGFTYDHEPAALGTFLGVYGHVTAIARRSGAVVHIHPLGAPATKGSRSVLTFHTVFRRPGAYRLFVQVRVSGIVRTVPVNVRVTTES